MTKCEMKKRGCKGAVLFLCLLLLLSVAWGAMPRRSGC